MTTKNRKPFSLVLLNSSIHSVDFALNAVRSVNPSLGADDAKSIVRDIMLKGRAVVLSGTRQSARNAAKILRNLGGDITGTTALRIGYGIDVPSNTPLPHKIIRGGRLNLPAHLGN